MELSTEAGMLAYACTHKRLLAPPPHAAWLITKPYIVAMSAGLLEFFIESWLCPQPKQHMWSRLWVTGLMLVVVGELIRKAGMVRLPASFIASVYGLN